MKTLLLGWMAWAGLANMQITLRLVNSTLIPSHILREAKPRAERILSSAGIQVRWIDCPCPADPGPGEFWLHVLTAAPERLKNADGFAVIFPPAHTDNSYAGIFYRNVERTAGWLDFDTTTVLGATVAHEIGHLLIGSNGHSSTGVMRARLTPVEFALAARGDLKFSAEDAARIRKRWEGRARVSK